MYSKYREQVLKTHPVQRGFRNTVTSGLSDTGLSNTYLFDTGLSDTGLSNTGLSNTGLFDTGLSDTGLSDTGLSGSLIYPTLCCESPSLKCTQFYLIYPTPGSSGIFMGNRCCRINQIPLYICTYVRMHAHTYAGFSLEWFHCSQLHVQCAQHIFVH